MAEPDIVVQEATKDLQGRVELFNKEMQALLGKYELGLTAVPFLSEGWQKVNVDGLGTLVPPGTIMARPQLVEMKGNKKANIPVTSAPPAAGLSEG